MDTRKRGKVKFFKADAGYGIILPGQGGPDVFVFHRDILMEGYRVLHENEEVLYTEVQNGDKGLMAVNVVPVKGGSQKRYNNKSDFEETQNEKPSLARYRSSPGTNFPMR